MPVKRHVLGIFIALIGAMLALQQTAQAAPPANFKTTPGTPIDWNLLENQVLKFRLNAEQMARDEKALKKQDFDSLEGLANEAVLSRMIKSTFTLALEKKWTQVQGFRIFPVENVLSNSAKETPVTFNPKGFRVAVFGLRQANVQRGVFLTSSFQSINPAELRELYRKAAIAPMVETAQVDYDAFATEVVERLRSGDSRKSRHLPVAGSADAWVVGCETTIAGRFCVNATIFDSNDTDPSTFISALSGARDQSDTVAMIRAQNHAWPIEKTHISRGYKSCACNAKHFGLDLTAPIGTPVYAIGRGVVLHAKKFSGWGNAVVLEHELPNGSKYISLYAHLSKFRKGLTKGDIVERGALIAATGKSGSSAAGQAIPPHLHLEIRNAPEGKEPLQQPKGVADRPLDPLQVLDIFNVFVASENLNSAAGDTIEFKIK